MALKVLPDVTWPAPNSATAGLADRDTLNKTATASAVQTMNLVPEGTVARIVLGCDRLGADVVNVLSHAGYLVVQAVWCWAPGGVGIEAIESVTFGDAAVPAGVARVDYLGLAVQSVDPWLAAAFAAAGQTYTDTLPGVAYSVFRIPAAETASGLPTIAAIIKGAKLYDPRTGLTAWSENPSVALSAFVAATDWGMAQPVDWTSVVAAADANDELVGGEPRRRIGLTLGAVQRSDAWLETLRTYASCWVVPGNSGVRLVPDRPTAVSATLAHDAGQIRSIAAIAKRGRADTPTMVRVVYTDTSQVPWREGRADSGVIGVSAGPSVVSLPGIHSYAQAKREAIERLNKLTLSDLSCELEAFDEAVAIESGDVIAVSHPIGLTAKPMRVLQCSGEYGRFRLSLAEYDPAAYSDAVESVATYPDTQLPSVTEPPAPSGLVLTEEVYQLADGTYSSRIAVTWDATSYPWFAFYRVEVRSAGAVVWDGTPVSAEFKTGAIQEAQDYQVDVRVVSRVGAVGTAASATIVAQGKMLLPGNVPALSGFEVGGEVRLAWEPAVDIDIWRYEMRWGAVGVAWADAKILDRVDALRLVTKEIPPGTWDFLVAAIDSVQQYSPAPARKTITVTLDAAAFLVDKRDLTVPALTNVAEYRLHRTDAVRRFVTESGASWASLFPGVMAGYTAPLAHYSAAGVASSVVSEVADFGLSIAGSWRADIVARAIDGDVVATTIDLSNTAAAGPFVADPALSSKATARWARVSVAAAAGNALYAELPAWSVRVDAVPREEVGQIVTVASGVSRVNLTNRYVKAKTIQLTPVGSVPRTACYDNVVMTPSGANSFDVYLFNQAGAQVAGPVDFKFEGV